jgi:hypothetical protein
MSAFIETLPLPGCLIADDRNSRGVPPADQPHGTHDLFSSRLKAIAYLRAHMTSPRFRAIANHPGPCRTIHVRDRVAEWLGEYGQARPACVVVSPRGTRRLYFESNSGNWRTCCA